MFGPSFPRPPILSCMVKMKVSVTQLCPLSMRSSRQEEWVAISFSRGLSWPRNWTRSPALQGNSLQSEPPGKPCMGTGNWICNPCRSQDYTKGIIYKANSELIVPLNEMCLLSSIAVIQVQECRFGDAEQERWPFPDHWGPRAQNGSWPCKAVICEGYCEAGSTGSYGNAGRQEI